MDHVSAAGLAVTRLEQIEVLLALLTAIAPPAGGRYADMSPVGR